MAAVLVPRRPARWVAGTGEALRPNAAMVYGLYDLRGDDPVKLVSYEAVYRRFGAGDPVYFQPVTRWTSASRSISNVRRSSSPASR